MPVGAVSLIQFARKDAANTFSVGTNEFRSGAAGTVTAAARAHAGQTVALFEYRNSSGTMVSRIDQGGQFVFGPNVGEEALHLQNGNMLLDNTRGIKAKTTGGAAYDMLLPYSDDNVYLSAHAGSLILRTAGGTARVTIDSNGVATFHDATIHEETALTDAATIATNARLGDVFTVSSATDRTLGVPTNAQQGMAKIWRWKNTDAAPHTLTLAGGAGGFRFGSTITGTTATAAGKTAYIGARYHSVDDVWDVLAYSQGF